MDTKGDVEMVDVWSRRAKKVSQRVRGSYFHLMSVLDFCTNFLLPLTTFSLFLSFLANLTDHLPFQVLNPTFQTLAAPLGREDANVAG